MQLRLKLLDSFEFVRIFARHFFWKKKSRSSDVNILANVGLSWFIEFFFLVFPEILDDGSNPVIDTQSSHAIQIKNLSNFLEQWSFQPLEWPTECWHCHRTGYGLVSIPATCFFSSLCSFLFIFSPCFLSVNFFFLIFSFFRSFTPLTLWIRIALAF